MALLAILALLAIHDLCVAEVGNVAYVSALNKLDARRKIDGIRRRLAFSAEPEPHPTATHVPVLLQHSARIC